MSTTTNVPSTADAGAEVPVLVFTDEPADADALGRADGEAAPDGLGDGHGVAPARDGFALAFCPSGVGNAPLGPQDDVAVPGATEVSRKLATIASTKNSA